MTPGTFALPAGAIRIDLSAHDIAPPVARFLRDRVTARRLAEPVVPDAEAWADLDAQCRTVLRGGRWEPSSWDVEGAAEVLDVSQRRVLQWLADGTLTGRRTGRAWRVDPASVRSLAAKRQSTRSG